MAEPKRGEMDSSHNVLKCFRAAGYSTVKTIEGEEATSDSVKFCNFTDDVFPFGKRDVPVYLAVLKFK